MRARDGTILVRPLFCIILPSNVSLPSQLSLPSIAKRPDEKRLQPQASLPHTTIDQCGAHELAPRCATPSGSSYYVLLLASTWDSIGSSGKAYPESRSFLSFFFLLLTTQHQDTQAMMPTPTMIGIPIPKNITRGTSLSHNPKSPHPSVFGSTPPLFAHWYGVVFMPGVQVGINSPLVSAGGMGDMLAVSDAIQVMCQGGTTTTPLVKVVVWGLESVPGAE